jgi:hypothetical protein
MRWIAIAADGVVAGSCLLHVVLVGAAIGAYGEPAVSALLPHGPVELAAFSLALALYVGARREPLTLRPALTVAGFAVAGLVVGAVIEVYA